jgi:outer membrane protein assembly factor BamB
MDSLCWFFFAKMKTFFCVSFFIIAASLTVCNCRNGNASESEPAYTAKIAWDSGLLLNASGEFTLDENYVYFFERPPEYDIANIYNLTKIDAGTGKLVWRNDFTFSDIHLCPPLVIDEYLYVFIQSSGILCFNKKTGQLSAVAKAVDSDGNDLNVSWNKTAHKNKIFFGAYNNKTRCLAGIDVHNIVKNGDAGSLQAIPIDVLWQPEKKTGLVYAKPVIHNDIIYAATSAYKEAAELAGIDIAGKKKVFYQTFGLNDDGTVYDNGRINEPLYIHNDILYYLGRSLAAYNLKKGKMIWHHVFETQNIFPKNNYAANTYRAVFYKKKIYYTSGAHDEADTNQGNIHCIDAKTGKLVWSTIAKGSFSIKTNPVIAAGKLYVPQYNGFRVYNPATGKLSGADTSFRAANLGRNVLYKKYLICPQYRDSEYAPNLAAVDIEN